MHSEITYSEYAGENWTHRRLPDPALDLESIDTVDGKPRFRVVDGSTATEILKADGDLLLHDTKVLKYPYCNNKLTMTGRWKANGQIYAQESDAPKEAIVVPEFDYKDFGVPRYVVEVYRHISEPNQRRSGYTFAWYVQEMEYKEGREISHFRQVGAKDIKLAKKCLALIQRLSKAEIKKRSKEEVTQICKALNDQSPRRMPATVN